MKKYLLLLSSLCITSSMVLGQTIPDRKNPPKKTLTSASYRANAFIEVNTDDHPETDFDITQLVGDVLIAGGATDCPSAGISNVTITPGPPVNASAGQLANYKENRPWGYFHRGATNFPFESGIVLVTGRAREAGNEAIENVLSSSHAGGSDPDLVIASGTTSELNDAVALEFDFVAVSSQITFRYIFASEEYAGTFACTYDDAFALLLRRQGETDYTNLAVLPNNAGPVAVTNIHGVVGASCDAVNEQYFAGINDNAEETNFRGRTVPLTAIANVIPGETYHFKMVIADARDSSYNSAVFLEAGSFDVGLEIVDQANVTLPSEVTICENYSQLLKSSVEIDGATYQWSYNGQAINGANSSSYEATEPGTYTVDITVPGTQCPASASIQVLQIPQPPNRLSEFSGIICEGDFITLDAGAPIGGQDYTYEWSNGETTQTINATESGMYTVNIDNGNCIESYSTRIDRAEEPVISNIKYNDGVLTITAETAGAGELEYSIDGGNFWQQSNVFTDVESNIDLSVFVRVKTTTCFISTPFYTFKMLNVITPNGDNKNDFISFENVSRYDNFNATIFDRYGKVIYEYTDLKRIWDGSFQGKKLSTDSYWYKLSYENPISKEMEVLTGWILLKHRAE